MGAFVYLAYDADEMELPVGVYDTVSEVCMAFGITYSNFFKYLDKEKTFKGVRFIKVRIDDV